MVKVNAPAYKKLYFLGFLVISLLSFGCCSPFFTVVEYPSQKDLFKFDSKKVGMNLKGELFVMKKEPGQSPEWTQDFGSSFVLMSWLKVLSDMPAKRIVDFVIRQAGFRSLQAAEENPFATMVNIVENLCFLAEMKSWRRVFFGQGPLLDSEYLKNPPTIYDDVEKGGHQRMRLSLESARNYANIGAMVDQMHTKPTRFPAKAFLVVNGPPTMFRKSLALYKKCWKQVPGALAKLVDRDDYQTMESQLSLKLADAALIRYMLKQPELLGLTESDYRFFQQMTQYIEIEACPECKAIYQKQKQAQAGGALPAQTAYQMVWRDHCFTHKCKVDWKRVGLECAATTLLRMILGLV